MDERTIYELTAEGHSLNGWKFKLRGAVLYERREDAEADIPRFRANCVDRKHFECAQDDETLEIKIVERRLQPAHSASPESK